MDGSIEDPAGVADSSLTCCVFTSDLICYHDLALLHCTPSDLSRRLNAVQVRRADKLFLPGMLLFFDAFNFMARRLIRP